MNKRNQADADLTAMKLPVANSTVDLTLQPDLVPGERAEISQQIFAVISLPALTADTLPDGAIATLQLVTGDEHDPPTSRILDPVVLAGPLVVTGTNGAGAAASELRVELWTVEHELKAFIGATVEADAGCGTFTSPATFRIVT